LVDVMDCQIQALSVKQGKRSLWANSRGPHY
jgi:hypothetical protein